MSDTDPRQAVLYQLTTADRTHPEMLYHTPWAREKSSVTFRSFVIYFDIVEKKKMKGSNTSRRPIGKAIAHWCLGLVYITRPAFQSSSW